MNPNFFETEAFQKRTAGRVLRKYPAGELVHASLSRRFDQRGQTERPSPPAIIRLR